MRNRCFVCIVVIITALILQGCGVKDKIVDNSQPTESVVSPQLSESADTQGINQRQAELRRNLNEAESKLRAGQKQEKRPEPKRAVLVGDTVELLKLGTKDEAVYFVDEFFKRQGAEALNSTIFRQYIVMDVYFCVASFLEELQIGREEIASFDVNSELLQSKEHAVGYVTKIMEKAVELRDKKSSNRYGTVVDQVKKYIEEHYEEEELSLNLLASYVNFSPNHLSMIFSQQTGQTFIKYLTDFRMNMAKELLRCTGKRSSIISAEVGYKDPHYFSYLFKKTQGMTPTQYRGGKQPEGEE